MTGRSLTRLPRDGSLPHEEHLRVIGRTAAELGGIPPSSAPLLPDSGHTRVRVASAIHLEAAPQFRYPKAVFRGPLRLVAQDTALSRREQGVCSPPGGPTSRQGLFIHVGPSP